MTMTAGELMSSAQDLGHARAHHQVMSQVNALALDYV